MHRNHLTARLRPDPLAGFKGLGTQEAEEGEEYEGKEGGNGGRELGRGVERNGGEGEGWKRGRKGGRMIRRMNTPIFETWLYHPQHQCLLYSVNAHFTV